MRRQNGNCRRMRRIDYSETAAPLFTFSHFLGNLFFPFSHRLFSLSLSSSIKPVLAVRVLLGTVQRKRERERAVSQYYRMKKLFSSKKSKRRQGDLKIPIPMVGGTQNAELSESQVDALLTGRHPKGKETVKPASSISADTRSNHLLLPGQSADTRNNKVTMPARRPISSPPVLAMPKPRHPLAPAKSILRGHESDKTQMETVIDTEENHGNKDNIAPLSPPNWIHPSCGDTTELLQSNQLQRQQLLAMSETLSREELTAFTGNEATFFLKRGNRKDSFYVTEGIEPSMGLQTNKELSKISVASSSEDSNRQYDSAPQSPVVSVSSTQTTNSVEIHLLNLRLPERSETMLNTTALPAQPTTITAASLATPKRQEKQIITSRLPSASSSVNGIVSSNNSSSTVNPSVNVKTTMSLSNVTEQAKLGVTPKNNFHSAYKPSSDPRRNVLMQADPSSSSAHIAGRPCSDSGSSFDEKLETLRRQVDQLKMQRELDRQQWMIRESKHRILEQEMQEKIHDAEEQLSRALAQKRHLERMRRTEETHPGRRNSRGADHVSVPSDPASSSQRKHDDDNDHLPPDGWDATPQPRRQRSKSIDYPKSPRYYAYADRPALHQNRSARKDRYVDEPQEPVDFGASHRFSYTYYADVDEYEQEIELDEQSGYHCDYHKPLSARHHNSRFVDSRTPHRSKADEERENNGNMAYDEELPEEDEEENTGTPRATRSSIRSRNSSNASSSSPYRRSRSGEPELSARDRRSMIVDGEVPVRQSQSSRHNGHARRPRSLSAPQSPQDFHSAFEEEHSAPLSEESAEHYARTKGSFHSHYADEWQPSPDRLYQRHHRFPRHQLPPRLSMMPPFTFHGYHPRRGAGARARFDGHTAMIDPRMLLDDELAYLPLYPGGAPTMAPHLIPPPPRRSAAGFPGFPEDWLPPPVIPAPLLPHPPLPAGNLAALYNSLGPSSSMSENFSPSDPLSLEAAVQQQQQQPPLYSSGSIRRIHPSMYVPEGPPSMGYQ